jgi:hypothetical protein
MFYLDPTFKQYFFPQRENVTNYSDIFWSGFPDYPGISREKISKDYPKVARTNKYADCQCVQVRDGPWTLELVIYITKPGIGLHLFILGKVMDLTPSRLFIVVVLIEDMFMLIIFISVLLPFIKVRCRHSQSPDRQEYIILTQTYIFFLPERGEAGKGRFFQRIFKGKA